MNQTITPELLRRFGQAYSADPVNVIRANAVKKNGIGAASENQGEEIANQMVFSIEIESGEITNQQRSGRCWLFAGLNTLRLAVMRKLNLETFELSQNYMLFWDKLEKANYYLESILETVAEPVGSRLLAHLLAAPMQDGGQWDMFCALVEKYGCVPKAQMPETFHSSETQMMNRLLTLKLREYAVVLREAATGGADAQALRTRKEEMLSEIYRMLCISLGEPPQTFDFEYRDKDKQFTRAAGLTPQTFYQQYVGQVLDDYLSIIHAPTQDKPYLRTFTVSYLGNVLGGRPVKYLNLPVADLKALAIAQLSEQEPVWFGCDVGQRLGRTNGLMGLETYNYEALLGTRFPLDKAQRLDYGESVLTHAMVLLGVNLVDGKPNRWKVENSWGDTAGQKGYYIMTDTWFDEFTYQIVVHKKHLSKAQLDAFATEPIVLAPWDPMGSLA